MSATDPRASGGALAMPGAAVLAALAAAASWLCCLPLVLGVTSAGAAGMAALLAPARPWLTAASLGLLALALARELRPHRRDRRQCDEEGRCRSARAVRRRRLVLGLSTLLVALLLTLPHWSSWLIYWTL